MSRLIVNRRTLIKGAGAAAFAAPMGYVKNGWAQGKQIQIGIWGGNQGEFIRKNVLPAFEKEFDCKVLAQNLCAYKEDRGRSVAVLFGERNYYSTEQFRAVAARHWQAGADGQFIWNQHFLKFDRDARFDAQSWKEIGDPRVLARKDKHYLVGPKKHGGSLPQQLVKAGDAAEINVEIADDLAGAQRDGVLREVTLRLLIEQLTALDQVDIRLNDVPLEMKAAKTQLNYNDCWLDFTVATVLRQGDNRLTITTAARNPYVLAPLTIRHVDAFVRYEEPRAAASR